MRERFAVILTALLIGGALGAVAVVFVARSLRSDGRVIEGQPIAYWVRCLESDNEGLRQKAVTVLPQFGEDAIFKVMPKLDSGIGQDGAVEVLAQIGAPAVLPLIDVLPASSSQMRVGAIRALRGMGQTLAAPAVSEVSKLLNDDTTGPLAAQFLYDVGPNSQAVGAALEVLETGTEGRRADAVKVIARAKDGRVEPALAKALGDIDPAVRVAAFEALCSLEPPSVNAAPLIINGLVKTELRAAARAGMARLGTSAIPQLHACTTRPAVDLRLEAIGLLAQHVAREPAARAALVDFVNDKDAGVSASAAASLVSMHKQDLPFVKKQLASPHAKVRVWAINEVRKVQPPLFDEIAPLLDDPDESVRVEATEAIRGLWQVDDPFILHAPRAKDTDERIKGIRLLPFFRDLKKYDMMLAAMEDPHPQVRLAATRALGRSLTSGRAVQRLVEAMREDQSPQVRADAASSLRAARSTGNVEAALRAATQDPDPTVAAAAQASLHRREIDP